VEFAALRGASDDGADLPTPEACQWLGVASWKPGRKIEVIGNDSSNREAKWAWLVNSLLMDDPK
jgi:hypothetical protein